MDENVKEDKTGTTNAEHRSDNIAVTVEQQPGCQVRLEVTIFPKAAEAAYKKALKLINKEVSLPGFRKGKAPEAIIVQHYKSHIDKEWRELMLQTAFSEGAKLADIYPLNEKSIKKPQVKNIARDNDSLIIFEYESAPKLPDVDPKTLVFKKIERKKVTQKEVDDYLDGIRQHHATWEDVTDRPAQDGDYVEVTIEDLDNPGRMICEKARMEVTKGKMGEWLRQLVLGMNIGESAEATSEPSPDWDPEKEFKATRCKTVIDAIKTATLPEVDDELAKKVGLSTAEELKTKAEENLNTQADEAVRHNLREQVPATLYKHYPCEVPNTLLVGELKGRGQKSVGGPKKEEETDEAYAKRAEVEASAKEALYMFFLTRKIAEENSITVENDELVRELMMGVYSQSISADDASNMDEVRGRVYVNLLTQKVKDFVLDNATIE